MLGRSISRTYPPKRAAAADAPIALAVRHLSAPGVIDCSLELRAGEIVGLAGLVGAGRTELAQAIYGATPASGGTIEARGRAVVGGPLGSIAAGMAMIPESRKDDGLLLRRPVRENVSLSSLAATRRFGLVQKGAETARVARALDQVSASATLDALPVALSGGNQQKLLFARAVLARPGVLIADDPTRGVDVGAKRDLYELLVSLAGDGLAILLISNEIEEILGIAHRVVVMRGGRVVTELSGSAMNEEAIVAASFGKPLAIAG
jgi:simple sugar transport system ATP-binding protein/ribose transport system ATP-binding protein